MVNTTKRENKEKKPRKLCSGDKLYGEYFINGNLSQKPDHKTESYNSKEN